jgi:diacylglycerol kinase
MPRRFVESFVNAWRGIRIAYRTQRNMTVHTVIGVFAVVLSVYLRISSSEFALILLAIFAVIILELINTSIEELVNMMTLKRGMRAMVAKDVAAAAVLTCAFASLMIGAVIFIPKILRILGV